VAQLRSLTDSITCSRAGSHEQAAVEKIADSVLLSTSNWLNRQKAKAEITVSVILVVDDDSAARLLVRSILEIAGHEVIEAPHGSAALNLISPHRPHVSSISEGSERYHRQR
jgi:PleD family two-component response regulator